MSQVIFLFLAYLCLASNKHAKLTISVFKFFSYFPDVPLISEIIDEVGKAKVFTKLD